MRDIEDAFGLKPVEKLAQKEEGKMARIFTCASEGKPSSASEVMIMVGKERLGMVRAVKIEEIKPGGFVVATIEVAVRLGDA